MSDFNFGLGAFGAHPDDVEICCGGLVAKMAAAGHKTVIVDLTRGELGSRGSAELRDQESAKASKILGVTHRENLSFMDGGIDSNNLEREKGTQLGDLVRTLRRLRPEIVALPFPKCRHPDHVAAGTLITRALFFAALPKFEVKGAEKDESKPFTPRQVLYYQMRYQFRPSLIVDISDVYELKTKAIHSYATQFAIGGQGGKHQTLISSPLSLSSIEIKDRYFGAMIGVMHGEAFYSRATLAVRDPIAHFRENPVSGALFFEEQE